MKSCVVWVFLKLINNSNDVESRITMHMCSMTDVNEGEKNGSQALVLVGRYRWFAMTSRDCTQNWAHLVNNSTDIDIHMIESNNFDFKFVSWSIEFSSYEEWIRNVDSSASRCESMVYACGIREKFIWG